jgi:hypothetical protein
MKVRKNPMINSGAMASMVDASFGLRPVGVTAAGTMFRVKGQVFRAPAEAISSGLPSPRPLRDPLERGNEDEHFEHF